MSKINIIEPSVYNRISAGEVIERPVSVVKECVENSLDGGASEISIYVSNDAKNIRIVDNGNGMSKDDAKLAFLPHCTSKLKTAEDLNEIMTLGFRGEALASIASIAMVTMNTFDIETEEATKIEIRGGDIVAIEESPITGGTDIFVENLFYNTPVREKFLKSPRSEESEISNLVTRMILSNPHTAFNYYLNNEQKLKFNGDGIEKAIYMIYGKSALDNSIRVVGDKNDVIINGYIGKPDYTKGNRTYQTLILNGRYVINETISMAIYKAYQPFLMKRCYPFYVLNVEIPLDKVDVNVHPTKRDVRFSDSQAIFKALYGVVSSALSGEVENIVDKSIFKLRNDTPIFEEKDAESSSSSKNEQLKLNTKYIELSNNEQEKSFVQTAPRQNDPGLFINTDIPLDVNSERYRRLYNIVEDGVQPLERPFEEQHDLPYYDTSVMAKVTEGYTARTQKPLKPVVN
ncbi:MAG: DNA mismatch repair endonuclease MutL, partial [Clostridia bacterium]